MPLKWTAIIVRVLLVLFAGMMIYEVGHVAVTSGANAYGSRGTESLVCARPPALGNVVVSPESLKAGGGSYLLPYAVEKGVEPWEETVQLCKDDSSLGVQLLYQSSRLATALVLLVALLLLDRVIAEARRESEFDQVVVGKLRFLGGFLFVGTLVASLYTALVQTGLADSMVASPILGHWELALSSWEIPWAYLIAGLGLMVMAKVVRVGAHMREELQGTV